MREKKNLKPWESQPWDDRARLRDKRWKKSQKNLRKAAKREWPRIYKFDEKETEVKIQFIDFDFTESEKRAMASIEDAGKVEFTATFNDDMQTLFRSWMLYGTFTADPLELKKRRIVSRLEKAITLINRARREEEIDTIMEKLLGEKIPKDIMGVGSTALEQEWVRRKFSLSE